MNDDNDDLGLKLLINSRKLVQSQPNKTIEDNTDKLFQIFSKHLRRNWHLIGNHVDDFATYIEKELPRMIFEYHKSTIGKRD